MINQVINTIGLLFNIGGVVLLFFFAPPQPNFEEGVGLGLEDATKLSNGKTVAEHNLENRKRKKLFEIYSRLSLILIFIGFILQLISTWLV